MPADRHELSNGVMEGIKVRWKGSLPPVLGGPREAKWEGLWLLPLAAAVGEEAGGEERRCMREAGPGWRPDLAVANAATWLVREVEFGP